MSRWMLLIAGIVVLGWALPRAAAEEAAADAAAEEGAGAAAAPAEGADQALTFVLREVKGKVAYQKPDSDKWFAAKDGKELTEGTKIKTAFESFVKVEFPAVNIVIVVNPTSQLTVTRAVIPKDDPSKSQTHVDVKYGGIKVKVTKDVERTDMRVATPNITASVTGSEGNFSSRPGFADRVEFATGLCQVQSAATGATVAVAAGESSQVTGGALLTALETARADRTAVTAPRGATRFEVAVAQLLPEVSGLLAGETNSEQGNPSFQRIIDQSSSNIEDARSAAGAIEFNPNIPPPLRQGPGKNAR